MVTSLLSENFLEESLVEDLAAIATGISGINSPLSYEGVLSSKDLAIKIRAAKIVIMDSEALGFRGIQKSFFDAGYENVVLTTESTRVVDFILQEKPDILLLDLRMSNIEVLQCLRSYRELENLPVVMLTTTDQGILKLEAIESGVTDFLAKPPEPSEMLLRIPNLLTVKFQQESLAKYSSDLEHQVCYRTQELEASRCEVIHCLSRAAESRDEPTGQHVLRVGYYVALIAQELGFSEKQVELLRLASQLHDVGKIAVSDTILLKPGKLNDREYEVIKKHCRLGKNIIEPDRDIETELCQKYPELGGQYLEDYKSPFMRVAGCIALTHHEKWDGSGYPNALQGTDIPIEGRITAVADVFDALTSKRPYKEPYSVENSFAILEEGRSQHFDSEILDAFFNCEKTIRKILAEYGDI